MDFFWQKKSTPWNSQSQHSRKFLRPYFDIIKWFYTRQLYQTTLGWVIEPRNLGTGPGPVRDCWDRSQIFHPHQKIYFCDLKLFMWLNISKLSMIIAKNTNIDSLCLKWNFARRGWRVVWRRPLKGWVPCLDYFFYFI